MPNRHPRPAPPSIRTPARILALALLVLVPTACRDSPVPNLDSRGTTIVALGDSITAGTGAPRHQSYPVHLSTLLGIPVVNAGVPGDTTADGLARLPSILAHDPWLVIVELGGNDLLRRRPAEQAEADLAALVEGLLAAGTAVVLVEVEVPLVGRAYDGMFDRLGDRFGVPVVEESLSEILADPSRKSDQIHPNALGYSDLARAVQEVVAPLVEKRREMGLPVAPRDAA